MERPLSRLPYPRLLLFLAILLLAVPAALAGLQWHDATVGAFDLAAGAFLASLVPLWSRGTPERLRAGAARDGGGRLLLPVIAPPVVAVILVALALVMRARTALGPVDLVLVLITLVLAWGFVNAVFALHYAHRFYEPAAGGGDAGGLEFPATPRPGFADFCYFSFVVGMTFQVSDVAISATRLRTVAMVHGMLAFFYNLGVLALVINVIAGIL